MAILAPAGAALAEPSIGEIEAQIDDAWGKLEPVIEDYNKVNSSVKKNQTKYDKLVKTLEPLELEVNLALTRIGGIAAQAYKQGPTSTLSAILDSDSPDTLLDQMSILNQISRNQLQEISAVKEIRDKYLADKNELDTLLSELKTQQSDLAGKKKTIEAEVTRLQKLRLQAYGTTSATGSLRPAACPYEYISGAAGTAASRACAQIGDPYVWGAGGPSSFDCSGLTMYAWANTRSLPHNAADQMGVTTSVSRANLRTGDLVFYGSSHVAIYVGGGWVVHAPHTGDVVRMAKLAGPGTPTRYGRVA